MFQEELKKIIKKLSYPLKDDDELREALKRKLTKKEFKLLEYRVYSATRIEIQDKLNVDSDRLEDIEKRLIQKLNFEKIKYELMVTKS